MVVRSVNEIQADKKHLLEELLGEQLGEGQRVFIMAYSDTIPDEAARQAAFDRIERTAREADEHAREKGISAEEADAAVEEAMRHVRRRPS